ncbi:MAG: thioester reductase domain-containing protein [Cyanobacteria bacterium J06621_8]
MLNDLIIRLKKLNIKLSLDQEELIIDAPKGALTGELITELKQYKPAIIAYLQSQGRSPVMTIETLKAEADSAAAVLPKSIVYQRRIIQEYSILLTGVTGFLGIFILKELLEQTDAIIYCLTRAKDLKLAEARIRENLQLYLLAENIDFHRVKPLAGDLTQPNLGLASSVHADLALNIDAIYHNGALVHHTTPYHRLKSTNVLGTQRILQLACASKTKPVHFISTISVFNFDRGDNTLTVKEQDNIEQYHAPLGGYAQSKWVAEKLVRIAGDHGLPVTIHRVGPVSGSSKTGAFNQNDFLYRLILGYVKLGSAPEGEMLLDILPVDFVSQAIVCLSQQENSWGKAFHLIHEQPASSDLLFRCLNAAGYQIKRTPYQKWYRELIDIAKNSPNHILYPLVSLFSANNSGEAQDKSFNLKFDCQNVLSGLASSSYVCPGINEVLINTYITYLKKRGLLTSSLENYIQRET